MDKEKQKETPKKKLQDSRTIILHKKTLMPCQGKHKNKIKLV